MSTLNKVFLLSTLSLALAACGGGGGSDTSTNNSKPTTPSTPTDQFTVKAKEWSFKGDVTVPQCYDIDLQQAVDCSTSTDWDVKATLNRGTPALSTNSGVSGSGKGGALYTPFDTTWSTLSQLLNATENGSLPSSAWATDAYSNGFTATKGYSFFEYDLAGDHKMSPNFKIFYLTTESSSKKIVGTEAKPVYAIQIYNYYKGTASGFISIRYIDTRNPADVRTIENIDASNGWAYVDLKSGAVSNTTTNSWQLAFNRYNVQTNTGIGSKVAAQPAGFYDAEGKAIASKFAATTNFVDSLAELQATAATAEITGSWGANAIASLLSPAAKSNGYPSVYNYGWFSYYPTKELAVAAGLADAHMLKANPDAASLIRSNTGTSYARLHLKNVSYADPAKYDSQATWTFEFDIQPTSK